MHNNRDLEDLARIAARLKIAPRNTKVAIVGGGKESRLFQDLFGTNSFGPLLVTIQVVVDLDPLAPGILAAQEKGIPTSLELTAIIREDIDIIIELTGDGQVRDQIMAIKPPHVQVMDHVSAGLFLDMIRIDQERVKVERKRSYARRLELVAELASFIAHEIRNPLVSIGGFARSVFNSPRLTDHSDQHKLRIVIDETNRLEQVLKRIMEYARPHELLRQETDLNVLVRETVAMLDAQIRAHQWRVQTSFDPDLPSFQMDRELIKQALINLIKNSLECQDCSGTLTIKTQIQLSSALITVSDDGPGMDSHTLANVFNPFFTTKEKTLGLGLAMTRRIIEDHDGEIKITTSPGQGVSV
ncbi:MAG: ATP-binding protein, partial [Deltaproteobacteria bacterium]|nr:ATP-binding protein [Deltaproteobacteria bacterium]